MVWHNGKPILSRLPLVGYQDNKAVQSLVGWVDTKLADKAEQLQNFYKQVDPDTADAASLDFLAWCVGLSGDFWDLSWSAEVKRILIKNSHKRLWSQRGTLDLIRFILNTHKITHSIWSSESTILTFRLPATFGTAKLSFYVRLPLKYSKSGLEFREAQRTLRNFAPAVVKHKVVYDQFYLGTSRLGDPLFS